MDQYTRLFGTARIPTEVSRDRSCIVVHSQSSDVNPNHSEGVGWKCTQIRGILSSFVGVNFVRSVNVPNLLSTLI